MTKENLPRIYCKAAVDVKKNFKRRIEPKRGNRDDAGRMFGGKSAQSVKDAEASQRQLAASDSEPFKAY